MFYTCHVKEVVYHRGEELRIRKSLKLCIVLYRNTMKNIKISWNKIWYTYTALIPTNMMFSLLNKCKFLFKCVSWTNDQKYWGRMHGLSFNLCPLYFILKYTYTLGEKIWGFLWRLQSGRRTLWTGNQPLCQRFATSSTWQALYCNVNLWHEGGYPCSCTKLR